MGWYPAYKAEDVIEEYAVRFFALLNEGYRIRFEDALLDAQISDLPHLKPEDRKRFYREIEWASQHPSDILKPSGQGSDPAQIKRLLGGK